MEPLSASRPRVTKSTRRPRGPRGAALALAKPSVVDVENQPTPPLGGLLQSIILVPRQRRLPQPRQFLVVQAPTIAVRLLTALVLALVLALESPPPVLLPPLPVEQLCSAVPWQLQQGLDLAQSQLRKLQKSGTHPYCHRTMLGKT